MLPPLVSATMLGLSLPLGRQPASPAHLTPPRRVGPSATPRALLEPERPRSSSLWELTKAQAFDFARAVGIDFAADEVVVAVAAAERATGEEVYKEEEAHGETYAFVLAVSLVFELIGPLCLGATLSLATSNIELGEVLRAAVDGAPAVAAAVPPAFLGTLRGVLSALSLAAPHAVAGPTADLIREAAQLADPALLGRALSAAGGAVGSLAAAAEAAADLRWLSFATEADAAAFASQSVGAAVGSIYMAAEASFYLACIAYGAVVSAGAEDFGFSSERRHVLWRRILADPSHTPQEFARSWFYATDGLSAEYGLGRSAAILLRYLASAATRAGHSAARRDGPPPPAAEVGPARAASHLADADRLGELPAFGTLTRGDARAWLARNLFYKDVARLSHAELAELESYVDELEAAAGEPLAPSNATTPGVRPMSAATDPVRWRHRPLLYYFITHWLGETVWTPSVMTSGGFVRRTQDELVYWYRPAQGAVEPGAPPVEALLFIHGVGVGPAPYAQWIEMAAPDPSTPVVAIELSGPAQRVFPAPPPTPERFSRLVADALDSLGIARVVVAGHSLGSAYASYLAGADARGELAPRTSAGRALEAGARRVGALVLIDPIACLLHHSRVTSQFVYTPAATLKEAADDFYFKKELFTASIISRHLPWHDAAVWLDERSRSTPTLVALSADDSIVPAAKVQAVFGSWQAKLRGVRVLSMPGIGHGGWLTDTRAGQELAAAVRTLCKESLGSAAMAAKAASAASAAASAASAASAYTSSAASGLGSAMGAAADRLGSLGGSLRRGRDDAEESAEDSAHALLPVPPPPLVDAARTKRGVMTGAARRRSENTVAAPSDPAPAAIWLVERLRPASPTPTRGVPARPAAGVGAGIASGGARVADGEFGP